jgi:hypothetical protein
MSCCISSFAVEPKRCQISAVETLVQTVVTPVSLTDFFQSSVYYSLFIHHRPCGERHVSTAPRLQS